MPKSQVFCKRLYFGKKKKDKVVVIFSFEPIMPQCFYSEITGAAISTQFFICHYNVLNLPQKTDKKLRIM